MIKAEKLEYRTITNALIHGTFYASHGPLIHNLWFEDGKIHIDCSEVKKIVLHTNARRTMYLHAEEGEFLTSADLNVSDKISEGGYIRITITDAQGNHANTNAYFADELLS